MHAHKKAFIKRGWLLLYDQGRAFEDVLEICLFDRGKLIKLLFFTYYSPWTFCTWEVFWENNSLPRMANWQVGISCFWFSNKYVQRGKCERNTLLGTPCERVYASGIPNFPFGYGVICQEITPHPLNTPSRTHHPDDAMSPRNMKLKSQGSRWVVVILNKSVHIHLSHLFVCRALTWLKVNTRQLNRLVCDRPCAWGKVDLGQPSPLVCK
jgi:hypothetical protein